MKKSLFLLELKRVFPSTLAFLLSIRGVLLLIEYATPLLISNAPRASGEFDTVAVILLIVSGFVSGTGAFSQEFKQRHLLFLDALPLGRSAQWSLLLLANFSAAVISVGLAMAMRPSLIMSLATADPLVGFKAIPVGYMAIPVYLFLFCAGACYTLLFRKVAIVYLLGVGATLVVLAEVFVLWAGFISDPQMSQVSFLPLAPPRRDVLDPAYLILALSTFALIHLFSSCLFFSSGEFYLFKTRARNWTLLLVCQLAGFMFAAIAQESSFFVRGDPYRLDPLVGHNGVASGDRWIAFVERRQHHPQFARIHVVDIRTGQPINPIALRGVRDVDWSPDQSALIVEVADDAPLFRLGYLLPPSDSLQWFSPEGRRLGGDRFWFSRIRRSARTETGIMLITKRRQTATIRSVDGSTRKATELMRADVDGGLGVTGAGRQRLIFLHNVKLPPRVWLVGSQLEELSLSASGAIGRDTYVFRRKVYESHAAAAAEIRKLYSFPPTTGVAKVPKEPLRWLADNRVVDGYVLPSWPWLPNDKLKGPYFDDATTLFYLRPNSHGDTELWSFDRRKQQWIPLARNLPGPLRLLQRSLDLEPQEGLAGFCLESEGQAGCHLFDARIGTRLDIPGNEAGTRMINIERVGNSDSFIVQVATASISSKTMNFQYKPGSGILKKLTLRLQHHQALSSLDDAGNAVIPPITSLMWFGAGSLMWVGADGTKRQLWPPKQ